MSLPALENIWEGMTGGKEVPDYMKYLQVGDYTGLPDVYLSFGGDELFLTGADSIRKRLEEYGVHVTVEICEGLYHSYAMLPLVKDAQEEDQNFVAYIRGKKQRRRDRIVTSGDRFLRGDHASADIGRGFHL